MKDLKYKTTDKMTYEMLVEEIERLNNILNHLEKELKDIQDKYIIEKEQTDNQYHYDLCNARIYAYQDILDKLKELKETNDGLTSRD